MVVHGCIDGSSHLVPYLRCENNNRASTVFEMFVRATSVYGIPSRVRSDHGLENLHVALFMNMVRGNQRGSHITGRSVHNQRIERFWRDVHTQVLITFKDVFYGLVDSDQLDVENHSHLQALHAVYVPVINNRLELFRQAWNMHKMTSDAAQRTPEQQWIDGMLSNAGSDKRAVNSVFQGETVERTLSEILTQQGLHPEPFGDLADENNLVGNLDVVPQLLPEQLNEFHVAVEGITDLQQRYIIALNLFGTLE
ncbi:uncharacterized protein LOC117099975 isoform X2 [Anneissia japonica]|nr:uncharacterized protein LOC117099975 isoform X2 [Anneissia japonica]